MTLRPLPPLRRRKSSAVVSTAFSHTRNSCPRSQRKFLTSLIRCSAKSTLCVSWTLTWRPRWSVCVWWIRRISVVDALFRAAPNNVMTTLHFLYSLPMIGINVSASSSSSWKRKLKFWKRKLLHRFCLWQIVPSLVVQIVCCTVSGKPNVLVARCCSHSQRVDELVSIYTKNKQTKKKNLSSSQAAVYYSYNFILLLLLLLWRRRNKTNNNKKGQ